MRHAPTDCPQCESYLRFRRILALTGLANLAIGNGRLHEALELYRSALALDVTNDATRRGLVATLVHLRDYDLALETYDEGIAAAPNARPERLRHRARLLLWMGRYHEALQDIDESLVTYPDQKRVLVLRFEALLKMGRQAQAKEQARALAAAMPWDAELKKMVQTLDDDTTAEVLH